MQIIARALLTEARTDCALDLLSSRLPALVSGTVIGMIAAFQAFANRRRPRRSCNTSGWHLAALLTTAAAWGGGDPRASSR
jgi:hypothetical protein